MQLRDGDDGPLVADFQASDFVASPDTATDSVGRTWTINRSATGFTTAIIDESQFLLGGAEHMQVPNAPGLNFGADDDFTLMVMFRPVDGTPASIQAIVDKGASQGPTGSGYSQFYHLTGRVAFQIADGTFGPVLVSTGSISDQTLVSTTGRRDTTADEIAILLDGVSPNTIVDTTTGTLDGPLDVFIGRFALGGSFLRGSVMSVHLWPRFLLDTEIQEAMGELQGLLTGKVCAIAMAHELEAIVSTELVLSGLIDDDC
jgi:hypothetical protein